MTSVGKEISALLTQASSTRSVPPLRQAFNMIKQLMEEAVVLDAGHCGVAPNDLYLFCCETALYLEEWDIATYCQDRVLEGTVTTKAYQARTLFCRAQLESRAARGLRCKELVLAVHSALLKLVRGMKIALSDVAQLSHLVLIGSQHTWNTCKPLYKEGTYSELLGTLGFIVYALEKIDCGDWCIRILWMLRHSNALAQSGRAQEANVLMTKVSETAAKMVPAWKYPIFRMQVALSKLIPNPKLKQDAAKGILRGVYAAQALLCGLVEPAAAEAEILASIAELSAEMKAEKDVPDAPGATKGGKAASPVPTKGKTVEVISPEDQQLREECLAELAFAASLIGDSQKAQDAAALALTFKPMKARIYAEFAQAQLQAHRCGGIAVHDELHSNWLSPAMVAELVSAVRVVDRALESAIRLGDQSERNHIVQQGCVLLWNVALPLLQPSLRSQVARSLQQAAKYLDDIGSNMNTLRTLLHLESALTDLDSDYLNKAVVRVDKALSIDYHVDPEEMAIYTLQRPLDRYLVWLKRRLGVRANMYQKPDNPEDEALLVVEQARDSSLISKLSMLTKAAKILQASDPPADYFVDTSVKQQTVAAVDPKAAKGAKEVPKKGAAAAGRNDDPEAAGEKKEMTPEMEEHRVRLRNRAQVWHMVLQSAWVEKSPIQLANLRAAADALLSRQWCRKSDRDMRHMQADAYLKLAEGAVVELRSKGLEVAQLTFTDGDDSDDDDADNAQDGSARGKAENDAEAAQQAAAIAEKVALVESAQTELQTCIVNAAKIGLELCQQGFEDQWIVYNACILLWNLHITAFKRNDFLAPASAIEQLYPILLAAGVDPKKETALLNDVAFTYVRSLLQQFARDKLPRTFLKAQILAQDMYALKTIEAGNARLLKAWEVCDKMINTLPTPMEAKCFLMASANIQRLLGKPMDARTHPQQRVLISIDQLNHPITVEEKRNVVTLAVDLLAQDPNVELCARVAERALAITGCEKIVLRVCAIGQSLYADGKLGWKQNKITAASTDPKAKDSKKAAVVEVAVLSPRSIPPPKPEDWYWYSLMLQYQGIATDMLVNPQVQDKQTQCEIRRQALVTLTNSALAAGQGPSDRRSELVLKVLRLYRNMCQSFVADAASRDYMLPSLRMLLSDKVISGLALQSTKGAKQSVAASDTDVLADLLLILVTCLKDASELQDGLLAMKQALKALPASHHKPFWSLDIELRCSANIPTNQTLLRIKEYDAEVQAQVWVTLARYAKSEQDQLFALKSAINVLEHKPVEQAGHILLLAQWMLEHNFNITLENFTTLVLSSCDLVAPLADTAEEDDQLSDTASNSNTTRSRLDSVKPDRDRGGTLGASFDRRSVVSIMRSTQGGRRREKTTPKSDLRVFLTSIQAHYLLAKVNGHSASTEDGTDTRNSLLMLLHYVMRLWGSSAHAVNQFIVKRHAKALKAEEAAAASAQVQQQQQAPVAKGTPRGTIVGTAATQQAAKDSLPSPTLHVIPATPQGWISYQLPQEFVDVLKQMRHPGAVSPSTVSAPEAVIELLIDAVSMMVREGLELQTHPLLALASLIVDTCLPTDAASQSAQLLNSLRRSNVLNMANNSSLSLLFAVVNPATPALERVALNEDAKTVLARTVSQPDQADSNIQRPVVPVAASKYIHKQWIGICEVLLLEGRVSSVRELIAVAHAHAKAYRDNASSSKCLFIKAKIFALEGYFAEALGAVQEALSINRCVCGHAWVDMRLFECFQLVALGQYEAAFAAEESVQQVLATQTATTTNVCKQIAERIVPELQCIFSTRFAATLLRSLSANSAETQVQLKKLLAKSVARAVDQALSCPHLKHLGLLLQVEFNGVEAECLRKGSQFTDLKRRLCGDARSLIDAATSIRSTINGIAGSLSTLTTIQRSSSEALLSRVLCSLGHNVIDRVRVNVKLLQTFRKSTETGVQYPTTDAKALEGHVVNFMRSSKKQRDAEVRKKKIAVLRSSIEEQRREVRAARQHEIEKRREQRRLDEAAVIEKAGAKNPKGKPAPAAAKGAPAPAVEEPDVDPNDKCGIDSPHHSEDDGDGEDSMSDEDTEMNMALKHVDGGDELHLTFADALDHFNSALAAATPDTAEGALARHGVGRSMLLIFEAMAIAADQRQALVRGETLPNLETSVLVESKWNRPIDLAEEVAVDTKAKGKAKEKEETKKPPSKGGAAAAAVTTQSPIAAAAESQSKLKESDILLQQATAILEASAKKLHADDNLRSLVDVLVDFARALVLKDFHLAAAQALECAQAAKMAQYVIDLWATAAPPQNSEAVIFRTLKSIRESAPQCVRSHQHSEVVRALYQSSKMFSRLRIPELPTSVGEPKELTPFSSDTCTLTITVDDRDGTMYATFRRHTGQIDVRRVDIRSAAIGEMVQELQGIHHTRTALFSTGKVDQELAEEVSGQAKDLVTKISVFFSALLAPFGAVFAASSKCHLILLLDPVLVPLPVDAIPALSKFRSVARDLSVHVVAAKLARRAVERFACQNPSFIVDACKESATALTTVFGNDEKPKLPGWQLLTSVVDENRFLRPLNIAVVQRNISNTASSTLAVVGSGRFSNIVPLSIVAALQFDHLRLVLLLDRGVNEGSIRRESQVDMKKAPPLLWAESPWNVALLLLARGVEFCFASMGPQLPSVNEALCRLAITNIDKPGQTKNFSEFFGSVLHDERGTSRVGDIELLFGDKISYAAFGIGTDETAAGKSK